MFRKEYKEAVVMLTIAFSILALFPLMFYWPGLIVLGLVYMTILTIYTGLTVLKALDKINEKIEEKKSVV